MQSILITGGTGLVGKKLTQLFIDKGFMVHIFSRSTNTITNNPQVKYFNWNPTIQTYDPKALENVVAVINLAGAGIADKRWTVARKKEILESRVQSGNTIAKALTENSNSVKVLIQASAIGWYNSNMEKIHETSQFQELQPASKDYLGQTCKAWEESIAAVENTTIRMVKIRIGIVLDKNGGMVKELIKPLQLGVLPVFGNGRQIVPWIHQDDLCGIILYAIENEKLNGVYNGVSPNPVSQKELTKAIAAIIHKKWFLAFPIPAFILKWMLGEMSIELLKSSLISAEKIKKEGYFFKYPLVNDIDKL